MDEHADKKLAHVQETIEQFESLIDFQRECAAEASKLWQQTHNKPDTLPDIGVLIKWLASEIENKQYTITCAVHEIADLRELLDEARAEVTKISDSYKRFCMDAKEDAVYQQKQLAEARAEIERLKNEHENSLDKAKNYTLELSGATTKQAGELADKDRQLTEARAEIERLQEWEYCMQTQSPYMAAGATWEQRHKRDQEVIAERDKLIEQMREALKLASLYIPDNATDAIRISEAALSAAERERK